jgi:hypothetical protein
MSLSIVLMDLPEFLDVLGPELFLFLEFTFEIDLAQIEFLVGSGFSGMVGGVMGNFLRLLLGLKLFGLGRIEELFEYGHFVGLGIEGFKPIVG